MIDYTSNEIKEAVKKYKAHRGQAVRRGIDFLLTFEQWYQWWQQQGTGTSADAGIMNTLWLDITTKVRMHYTTLNVLHTARILVNALRRNDLERH